MLAHNRTLARAIAVARIATATVAPTANIVVFLLMASRSSSLEPHYGGRQLSCAVSAAVGYSLSGCAG
jgi:hypothetical protein